MQTLLLVLISILTIAVLCLSVALFTMREWLHSLSEDYHSLEMGIRYIMDKSGLFNDFISNTPKE